MTQQTARTAPPPGHRSTLRHVVAAVPALLAALSATALGLVVPLLGPLLIALVLGAVVANTPLVGTRALDGHEAVTRLLLRLGVVLIGLKLPVGDIVGIGARGVVVVVATVGVTYGATRLIGSRTRLDHGYVALLAAGFSICGASAIAAVNDAVRAKEKDVAMAVAMVTLFGSGMILALPPLAVLFGLSGAQAAIWAGASIHEVAQVVAAASLVGAGAIAVATTVKLGRVALLAPTYLLVAGGREQRDRGVALVPWFLSGFVVAVAVRSLGVLPGTALEVAGFVTTVLLGAGMFGLGLGFRLRDLWPFPPAAVLLAAASTVIAAGTSLALIETLY